MALDYRMASSPGATHRGGAGCEGGCPRGWPGLPRAPARTPQPPIYNRWHWYLWQG